MVVSAAADAFRLIEDSAVKACNIRRALSYIVAVVFIVGHRTVQCHRHNGSVLPYVLALCVRCLNTTSLVERQLSLLLLLSLQLFNTGIHSSCRVF